MHEMRAHVLPINRFGVEYYLQKVWKVGFEMCIPLTQKKYLKHLPDWLEEKFSDYVRYVEERIRKNLEDVKYDLDELATVYIVTGPGRIEKVAQLSRREFQHNCNIDESYAEYPASVVPALETRHRDFRTRQDREIESRRDLGRSRQYS